MCDKDTWGKRFVKPIIIYLQGMGKQKTSLALGETG